MANELRAYLTSGKSVYAVLLNATGQAWNGSAFETLAGANWTNYDIALTEAVAGVYLGTLPSVAAGSYSYVVYEQAGATAAVTDALRGLGSLDWDGSAEVAVATVPAAMLAEVVEGALTMQDVLRIALAVLAGKSSGGGTTAVAFRDQADTLDRVAVTVDMAGNRSAVVLDVS